jgi:AraC-like DNA-binding protein
MTGAGDGPARAAASRRRRGRSLARVADPIVEGATALAAPPLRPFVAGYGGYRLEGFAPGVHRGLPSPRLTFIVSLDEPVEIATMPPPGEGGRFGAFVAGLHASPATIRHAGRQVGLHVDLTPFGAQALLGVPAAALAGWAVELVDLLGPLGVELQDRAVDAATWSERFAVLDDVLGRALRDAPGPRPEVAWAWRRVVETGGAVEIGALAREVGWSRRHLGARFRSELGLSPKTAARIVRFDRARTLLVQPGGPGLADVAAACGFFDQAHMTRDWHDLAGCAPTTWLAEELRSVLDHAAAVAAR